MIELTAEQRAAALALDRDVFLEAGAGSGKTSVLVARYCEGIVTQELTPDAILAFTFTERAAGELGRRISEELEDRGEQEAAGAVHAGWISTIHGFCRRLLASHPVAAGIDPRFSVIDAPEADRLADRAFDAAIEAALPDGNADRARMAAAIRIRSLRSMVKTAHDELRSMGREPVLPEQPAPDPLKALAALAGAATDALACGDLSGSPANKAQEAIALAERAQKRLPTRAELDAVKFGSSTKAAKTAGGGRLLEALADADAELVDLETGAEYGFVAEVLELFAARYAELKRARSALDFEDLQLEAVRLLREHDAIRDAYRERFRHVLVDEFQDTNRLQLDLVELLRGPETRLFTVGDELQSIYRFRHADLRVFREQRERFRAEDDAEVLELTGNFRSDPPVLDLVNTLGGAVIPAFRELRVGDGRTFGELPTPAIELLLTERDGWNLKGDEPGLEASLDDRTPASRVAEARFLAERLRALADEGVPRGDMVVLLRAFTNVGAYEEALERAGLNPYIVGGRGYWSRQQVDDARRLLGCVANPLDDECLIGALTAFGGVLPDTLWLLRRFAGKGRFWPAVCGWLDGKEPGEDGEPIELPDEERERLTVFRTELEKLRERAPVLPLEALVERSIRACAYDLAVLARTGGARRMANLRKLMRMAHEFEVREGRDLRGFLDHLESRAAASQRESEAATEAEDHDGVRVMTVHAAKGLEYPVVAVAELGRDLLVGGYPPGLRIDRDEDDEGVRCGLQLGRLGEQGVRQGAYRRLKKEADAAESEEARRLAHVAATRAQHRLLLSGVEKAGSLAALAETGAFRDSTSVLARLLTALKLGIEDRELELPSPLAVHASLPSPNRMAELNERAPAADDGDAGAPAGDPPLKRPAPPPEPGIGTLSYSALDRYDQCGYRFYAEQVLGLPGPAGQLGSRGKAVAVGSAVHELLEQSAREGWAEPADDAVAAALAKHLVAAGGEEETRVRELVEAWLGSSLRAELDGATLRPELPFLLGVDADGTRTIVRGSIDLLAELPGGGLLVVDYKTNRLDGAAPGELPGGYELQRAIYALAASQLDRVPIHTAYAFLEAPEEPLRRDFGPEELDLARALLADKVSEIRSGNFPVTGEPHAQLCMDCPARARLCEYELSVTAQPAA